MPNEERDGVHIGNVTGGISKSVIAGRDIRDVTITLGGRTISADKQPSAAELQQLLAEIRQSLAAIVLEQDSLKQISPASPAVAVAAEANVKAAAQVIAATPAPTVDQAHSVQQQLAEAASLLGGILKTAAAVAATTGSLAGAAQPLVHSLQPVVNQLAAAAVWVARLWLAN
jgi:hypothetical protein